MVLPGPRGYWPLNSGNRRRRGGDTRQEPQDGEDGDARDERAGERAEREDRQVTMAADGGVVPKSRAMTCSSGSMTRASACTMKAAMPSTSKDARAGTAAATEGGASS